MHLHLFFGIFLFIINYKSYHHKSILEEFLNFQSYAFGCTRKLDNARARIDGNEPNQMESNFVNNFLEKFKSIHAINFCIGVSVDGTVIIRFIFIVFSRILLAAFQFFLWHVCFIHFFDINYTNLVILLKSTPVFNFEKYESNNFQ